MKVKCINNDSMWRTAANDMMLEDMNDILTVGKTYYVSSEFEIKNGYNSSHDYFIEHDKGGKRWFSKDRFINIDVWREIQLNYLGIKEEDPITILNDLSQINVA